MKERRQPEEKQLGFDFGKRVERRVPANRREYLLKRAKELRDKLDNVKAILSFIELEREYSLYGKSSNESQDWMRRFESDKDDKDLEFSYRFTLESLKNKHIDFEIIKGIKQLRARDYFKSMSPFGFSKEIFRIAKKIRNNQEINELVLSPYDKKYVLMIADYLKESKLAN